MVKKVPDWRLGCVIVLATIIFLTVMLMLRRWQKAMDITQKHPVTRTSVR